MTYAILCGLCWIAGGVISYMETIKGEKMWKIMGLMVFLISFIIFVGLFGAVMIGVKERTYGLEQNPCKEEEKKLRRSGDEFMGYSICSFILIPIATGIHFYILLK